MAFQKYLRFTMHTAVGDALPLMIVHKKLLGHYTAHELARVFLVNNCMC